LIKTRELFLTPEQIKSIRVRPGETLHCAVNLGGLPPSKAKNVLDEIRNYLSSHLPAGTNLLVTSDQISFTVIQP
jgi:hypothetical protein